MWWGRPIEAQHGDARCIKPMAGGLLGCDFSAFRSRSFYKHDRQGVTYIPLGHIYRGILIKPKLEASKTASERELTSSF
jgi:hypothetical protein